MLSYHGTATSYWWLHASENPGSILSVVSSLDIFVLFFYQNLLSGIVYSIMSNKTLPYHTDNRSVCIQQSQTKV